MSDVLFVTETATYHLHEGTGIQSQGHDYEDKVGIVHFVAYEPRAVVYANSIGADDIDERYAPYPT